MILILSDFTYPNYIGGVPRHVYEISKYLYKNQFPFLVITRKKNG